MKDTDIPPRFDVAFAANASPGFITFPVPTSPGATDRASLDEGFPPTTMQPGGKPFGQDMNGVLLQSTLGVQWQAAGGPAFYDSGFSTAIGGYPKGAVISNAATVGWFWISLVDDNTSDPDTGGANWTAYTPTSLSALDTGTANAVVAAIVPAPPSLSAIINKPVTITKGIATSTGAVTLALNGLSPQSIIHGDGTALQNLELPGGQPFIVVPTGSNFILMSVASPAAAGVPTGSVFWFGASTPPTGYLECDGSSLLRAGTYAALFAIVGTTFGSADGTHFNLPDLRGEFVRGWDHGRGIDSGRAFGSNQTDTFAAHSHTVPFFNDNSGTTGPGHGGTTSSTVASGTTGSPETRPKNVALLPCIKY